MNKHIVKHLLDEVAWEACPVCGDFPAHMYFVGLWSTFSSCGKTPHFVFKGEIEGEYPSALAWCLWVQLYRFKQKYKTAGRRKVK